jgi:hypothetical protein
MAEEGPALQLRMLVGAFGTVLLEWLFLIDVDMKGGVKAVEIHLIVLDSQTELARYQRSSTGFSIAVENGWRGLDIPL